MEELLTSYDYQDKSCITSFVDLALYAEIELFGKRVQYDSDKQFFQTATKSHSFFWKFLLAVILVVTIPVALVVYWFKLCDRLNQKIHALFLKHQNPNNCVICMEDLKSDPALALKCFHVFHKNCVEQWLKRKNECPICRKENPHPDANFNRFADLHDDHDVDIQRIPVSSRNMSMGDDFAIAHESDDLFFSGRTMIHRSSRWSGSLINHPQEAPAITVSITRVASFYFF